MKIRLYSMMLVLAAGGGRVGWAVEASSATAASSPTVSSIPSPPTLAAPGGRPIELAVISTYCGERHFTVDPPDLRPKDIDILRQILSYLENGKYETFTYAGRPNTHPPQVPISGLPLHKGPTKEHILKLIREPGFAKRAGHEWMAGFRNSPENHMEDGLLQTLEANFGIRELNIIVTDANCQSDPTSHPPGY